MTNPASKEPSADGVVGERQFPILGDNLLKSIPWAMLEKHERQARSNHSQTLERLAERGGLSPLEAYAVIKGLGYHMVRWSAENDVKARDWLLKQIKFPAAPTNADETEERK